MALEGSFKVVGDLLNKILGFGLLFLLVIIVGLAISAGLWWWHRKRIIYDTDVEVWIRRHEGEKYEPYKDIGGLQKTRKGMIQKFHLKKLNILTKPPKPEWMEFKGGRRKLTGALIKDTFFPVVETLVEGEHKGEDKEFIKELKIVDPDMSFFTINVLDEMERMFKKQGFWDKYGAITLVAVGIMLNMIFIYVVTNNMIQIATSMNRAAENFREAASIMSQSRVPQTIVESTIQGG